MASKEICKIAAGDDAANCELGLGFLPFKSMKLFCTDDGFAAFTQFEGETCDSKKYMGSFVATGECNGGVRDIFISQSESKYLRTANRLN